MLFISFHASSVVAQETCVVSSAQDILRCALHQHPDVINAQAEKHRDDTLIDIAKQRPNPEFEGKVLGSHSADDTPWNTEMSLLHTLELGGKRTSRMNQARVLAEKAGINLTRNKEDVALQTVLSLYRLRQIQSELGRIETTLALFNTILSTFTGRPTLTPEQAVSKTSFNLARDNYTLKQISLIQEQVGLLAWLEVATNVSAQTILQYLPPPKSTWPEFPTSTEPDALANATVELARAEKHLAEKNRAVAQSKAWPDLKIGPSVDTESLDTGGTRWRGGVHFSVPLPLLNVNRAEKAFAKADLLRAQTNLELVIQKTESDRTLQLKRYQAAIKALRSSQAVNALGVEYQNIGDLFEKGLVPSTLVIETHHQLYEMTRTRNEQELAGVDALWRLYIIDGKVLDAKM